MNHVPAERLSAKAIFTGAIALEDPQQRNVYLKEACGGDSALRQKVEQLVAAANGNTPNRLDRIAEAFGPIETLVGAPEEETSIDISTHPEIGPYKLLEQIGEGGMGVVFMAQQSRPVKRRVALKLVKPGMDSREVIARFEAERQALAMMDHPHIARVLDAGATADGRPYFVMELVRGVPITEYCDRHRLPIQERLKLFIDVCHAVQHAHLKGVIHRDLKPSNVLVTQQDGQPVVKVIDFGVAKAIHQELTDRTLFTRFAQVVGTPLYMSPEQAALGSLDIDTRSDVYSLGVLLYELLTGGTPFDSKTLEAAGFDGMRKIIREQEPLRPSARVSTLHAASHSTLETTCRESGRQLTQLLRGDLDWIVMQALDKDRARRYQSATALADDVVRFLGDQPVLARPPSISYRLRKFVRRHRAGVSLALVVSLAVVVMGVSLSYAHWRNTQASTAEHERLAEISNGVEGALQSARAGIEAGGLPVAERWLESARVLLERDRAQLPDLARQVEELRQEFDARVLDAERYAELLRLARDAQDKMTYGEHLNGDIVAIQALELFGVGESADWITDLDHAYLTEEQKTRARAVIYETLLCLADYGPRWKWQDVAWLERSLHYSELARDLQEPTKAWHYVRHMCYMNLGREQDSQDAWRVYQQTPATIALDHYLPGHTAGWWGDLEAARAAYWAALRIQPDHFNSLFFLGDRMAADERHAEAVALYTGCIALRPEHVFAHLNRAECLEALGQLQDAEAELLTLIRFIPSDNDELSYCYRTLSEFYERTGQVEARYGICRDLLQRALESMPSGADAADVPVGWTVSSRFNIADEAIRQAISYLTDHPDAAESRQLLEDAERVLNRLRSTSIPDRERFLVVVHNLGLAWGQQGRDPKRALPLLEEAVAQLETHAGSRSDNAVSAMTNLAWVYWNAGQHDRSQQLINDILAILAERRGSEDVETLSQMRSLSAVLFEMGDHERTISFLEEVMPLHRRLLGETAPETIDLTFKLGATYNDAGRIEQAFELFETLHATLARERADDDDQRNQAANRLGQLCLARGETTRGIELLEEVYESSLRVHGAQDPETSHDLANLANALLYDGQWEQAEKLLTAFLDAEPMVAPPDERAMLFTLRGAARLDSGRRDEARDDFNAADIADASYNSLFLAAVGLHAAGDQEAYRRFCATMLDRSRELDDPAELHWIAWACALGGSHGDRDADVLAIAEKLATLQPGRREALLSLGALQYRQGDYEQAVQTLLAANATPSSEVTCEAYPWFFLALAYHRLGNETEAERWRQQALEYADGYLNEPRQNSSWTRRKTLELLRDELTREFAE